jgi:hypothetical protein
MSNECKGITEAELSSCALGVEGTGRPEPQFGQRSYQSIFKSNSLERLTTDGDSPVGE